jgi:hypothetical protein
MKNTTTCRLDIAKRGFSRVEIYRETTLPAVHHTDIMSIAYDKLHAVRRHITAHCTAGLDDDVNLSRPFKPSRNSFQSWRRTTSPVSATIAAVL